MRSKRASVPAVILVLGIFALCGFALVTFFISEFRFSNSFAMVDDLRAIHVFEDEWSFYNNQGLSDQEIMRKIEFPTEDSSSPDYTVNVSLNGGVKRVYIQRVRSPSLTESLKSIFSKSKKEFAYSIEYAFN